MQATPFVNTHCAYRVENHDGMVVARYIVDYRGVVTWSVVHGLCPYAHISEVLEASDRGEFSTHVVL